MFNPLILLITESNNFWQRRCSCLSHSKSLRQAQQDPRSLKPAGIFGRALPHGNFVQWPWTTLIAGRGVRSPNCGTEARLSSISGGHSFLDVEPCKFLCPPSLLNMAFKTNVTTCDSPTLKEK